MIRLVGSILVFALLVLFGAFSSDLRGFPGDPAVAIAAAPSGEPGARDESTPSTESTASLEQPSEDERAGVMLARTPDASRAVLAPSFERVAVVARAQAAPPVVHHETPTRPPRV